MNIRKLHTFSLIAGLGFALSAQAKNTLISGDITNGANWDTGLPDSDGNVGTIDSDNTGADIGTWSSASDLFIQQTGGVLEATASNWNAFENSSYEITNGLLDADAGFGLRLFSGSIFTLGGGDVTTGALNLSVDNSTFTMTDGTLTTGEIRAISSTFNFSGGTVNISGNDGAFATSSGTSAVNFSGDVDFNTNVFGVNGTQNIAIGSGTGSITTTTINSGSLDFDWTPGSGFSITATTIDGGSTWEDLWDAGKLTVDGAQSGTFASNFDVSGNTLTIIPEPSTFALLGLAGLAVFFLRRRR